MSDTDPVIPVIVPPVIEAPARTIIWELLKTLRGPGLIEIQVYRPMPPFLDANDFAKRLYLGRASTPLGWVEFSMDNAKDEHEAFARFPAVAQGAFQQRLAEQMQFNAQMQQMAEMNRVQIARANGVPKGMKHGKV